MAQGEVMQMHQAIRKGSDLEEVFDVYLRKTYHKTASLMANSCQVSVHCFFLPTPDSYYYLACFHRLLLCWVITPKK